MASKPISTPLPADLPTNWQTGQTVSPTGTEVGLTQQHGYNYQAQQINNAQTAINAINDAFENVYGDGDTVPVSDGGTGAKTPQEALVNLGAASNPNLLDNWYFVGGGSQQGGGQFPINQRGQTNYTDYGYGVDRWRGSSNSSISVSSDGILLESLGSTGLVEFVQYVKPISEFYGKTVTFSAIIKNYGLYSVTASISEEFVNEIVPVPTVGYMLIGKTGKAENNHLYVRFGASSFPSDQSGTIIAAKLELGPVQTLAHQDAEGNWVLNAPPPNFQQELAKCQRYQLVLGNAMRVRASRVTNASIYFFVPIPSTMRSTPSIVNPSNMQIYEVTGSEQPGFSFECPPGSASTQNGITIVATKASHGMQDAFLYIDGSISPGVTLLDANL